jgi:hypothetical protein
MAVHLLSKSSYLQGLQCEKGLYLHKYHYDWRDEITEAQQALFTRGHDVGKLAQNLFTGGVNASLNDPMKSVEQVELTKELIRIGKKIIYEAAFLFDDVLIIADILVKGSNNKWKIYEVKSSTGIKEVYIPDASIQHYVISNSGLDVSDISIVHINNEYVRIGDLDIRRLFNIVSVKADVLALQGTVKSNIKRFKKLLAEKRIPNIDIGPQCLDPYECGFHGYCWRNIPENSVFDISGLWTSRKFELYKSGIIRLEDVPDEFPLNYCQRLQIDSHLNQKFFIDRKSIKEFLNSLAYPLYFLDFETINPAVPLFDNSRPYQQIPFQYSLLLKESSISPLVHFEFLAEAESDPRISFLKNLLQVTKGQGDIIVYNKTFESARLGELAEDFPEYSNQIEKRKSRLKDLMFPFRHKHYYTPSMKGCHSLKAVLPALVPDLSYDELEIADGANASRAFESLYFEKDEIRKKEIREQLLKYCGMDTMAMVRILDVLDSL